MGRGKGWGEKERDKKKKRGISSSWGAGRQAGRASVHGRATHARSIKRAFTIDQRSIEVDHELKTVVTREARRPRQLFARLCKYLAAERRTRRWARLVGGLYTRAPRPPTSRDTEHASARTYMHRGGRI